MPGSQLAGARYGVHSIDHFSMEVPSLDEAKHFFTHFGLEVEQVADEELQLRCQGDPQVWGRLRDGSRKRFAYLSLNCYADDFDALRTQANLAGAVPAAGSPYVTDEGYWFFDPDGNLIQIKTGQRTMPERAGAPGSQSTPVGTRGVLGRSETAKVHPTRLSHILLFSSDINRSIGFFRDALGLHLSDRSHDAVAFMHARHGCDHHLVAFASSSAAGLHHTSWDVPTVNDVGRGAEQMRTAGFSEGWGTGRHVLGSNYFHYVRDPWGSFAEYSAEIDYVPSGSVWPAGDYPPEDSLYLWGPSVPENFIHNSEA